MSNLDDLKSRYESGYLPPINKKSHKSKNSSWVKIVIISLSVVVLIAVVVGGIVWHSHHKTPKAKLQGASLSVTPVTSTSSSTNNYVSNGSDLNLSFSYPSNWSVTPATNNNPNDQTITVTSPLSSIVNAQGNTVTGKIVVQVRPGSATISELNSNNPVESLASTQISYSKPTADQYQYPYISYIHFANGENVSGDFEEVIITGSQTFTQSEALSADYLAGLDPIISASFYQCASSSCTGSAQTPLSITNGTWQNAPIFQQVLSLFQSFQLN